MVANKIFGILLLLLMFMIQLNGAERKSDAGSPVSVQNIAEDEVPVQRDVHYDLTLDIAMFPYIPDLDGDNHVNLLNYIRVEYEKLNPTIHLNFRTMNLGDGFYNVTEIKRWFEGPGKIYDIVEVDTVILGDLVDTGAIAPQILPSRYPPADWHPAAKNAVVVNGEIYAYPHLVCSILLFTRDNNIASAVTIDQLVQAVKAAQPKFSYEFVGNLNSSWDAAALYIDSFRELHPPYNVLYHLDHWEYIGLQTLRKLAQLCPSYPDYNSCINGFFDDAGYDQPAKLFGYQQVSGMYGYSERLHQVLKQAAIAGFTDNYNIQIKPLPLGDIPNEPLFFTDAFVFRRGMSHEKYAAAQKFVEFMATPRMQAAVVAAEETATNKKPYRYLLPMSNKAYDVHPLNSDYFYQTYFRHLIGLNLPNRGMNTFREIGKEFLYVLLNHPN